MYNRKILTNYTTGKLIDIHKIITDFTDTFFTDDALLLLLLLLRSTTAVLQPLYRTTCVSQHQQL